MKYLQTTQTDPTSPRITNNIRYKLNIKLNITKKIEKQMWLLYNIPCNKIKLIVNEWTRLYK